MGNLTSFVHRRLAVGALLYSYSPIHTIDLFVELSMKVEPTVEINTTFYHFPRPSTVARWYKQTPKDYKFSFKIPKKITHEKKLKEDYWNDLMNFLDIMKGLKQKMGPALLQLPPKFSVTYMKNLEIFLHSILMANKP